MVVKIRKLTPAEMAATFPKSTPLTTLPDPPKSVKRPEGPCEVSPNAQHYGVKVGDDKYWWCSYCGKHCGKPDRKSWNGGPE